VGVIGDEWGSDVARRALDMLLSGSEHRTVYGYLEKMRRKKKLAVLDGFR
jgi:rRNA processing protein Krr1/Pno1